MKFLRLLGLAMIATALTLPLGGPATSQEPNSEESSSPTPSGATTPTPTETPSATPQEPEIVLTLETSRRVLTFGRRVTFSGHAFPREHTAGSGWEVCWVDRAVELRRAVAGSDSFETIALTRTDQDGRFSFRRRPRANARYHAYLPATPDCSHDELSPIRLVRVRVFIEVDRDQRRIFVRLMPCGEHRRDEVVLKRFRGPRDVYVEIAGRERLNDRCRARFRDPGGKRLQVVWPRQDDKHERGHAWVG